MNGLNLGANEDESLIGFQFLFQFGHLVAIHQGRPQSPGTKVSKTGKFVFSKVASMISCLRASGGGPKYTRHALGCSKPDE